MPIDTAEEVHRKLHALIDNTRKALENAQAEKTARSLADSEASRRMLQVEHRHPSPFPEHKR